MVQCPDGVLVSTIDRLLAGLPDADADAVPDEIVVAVGEGGWVVHRHESDGTSEHIGTGPTVGHVLDVVSWALNRTARASAGVDVPVLHAAAVVGRAGAAILCAASGTGKSTLAAAAACRGWTLASDDLAPILTASDPEVVPYPRPVTLRPGGRDVLAGRLPAHLAAAESAAGSWYVAPGDLGAVAPDRPVVLCHVVAVERGRAPSLTPLSRAATLHALATHCVTLADDPSGHLHRLEQVARVVPGSRLVVDPELRALDLVAEVIGAP